ncbi:MAG: non-ribosomal peptide synthetase, partial [bacterium]|nr:non-ribosomal peptide synthetase [bacterium]
ILRTIFVKNPTGENYLQAVLQKRSIEFHYRDITKIENRTAYVIQYEESDKTLGFDLLSDVAMRIAVHKTGEQEYRFTWSFHHILMDGWCLGILISEFFEIYKSYLENRELKLPEAKQYRNYIQWLDQQDKKNSLRYWEKYLENYKEPAGVPTVNPPLSGETGYRQGLETITLEKETTEALNKLAATNNATLNTVIQAVWGILLGKYNRREDVVFGAVVSGRPPGIEGVETIVGLFINTVPVRIRYFERKQFIQLVREIRENAVESEEHHYAPLAEIQARTHLKQRLIDHVMAFENYPIVQQITRLEKNSDGHAPALEISEMNVFEQSNYNINVKIDPVENLTIILDYNRNIYSEQWIKRVVLHFRQVCRSAAADETIEIQRMELLTPVER